MPDFGYEAKSVLARMGGEGRFIFFADSLRIRNKIKKVSHSDSQNYTFPLPPYS